MSTSSEGYPDNSLDAGLQARLRRLYAERFDVTQDGPASNHPPDVIPADGGLRAWLRELAQANTQLDQRTLFSITGLPLPLAPLPDSPTIWDFKRTPRYHAEMMRALQENASVVCNELLRHRQRAQRLPLDVYLVFRLPTPLLAHYPVRDLLNATLPHLCQLLQIAECDIYEPMPTKMDQGLSDAGLDVCIWLCDDTQLADAS